MRLKSIQPKPKKCKGTGVAIGYGCGEPQTYRTYGLGTGCRCYQKWLLESDAGKEKLSKSIFHGKKEVAKVEKAVLRDKVTDYKKFLQYDVQKIAKLIDYGLRGLHESKTDTGLIQGGHIYSKKNNEQMRFNLHNIHRQGAKSNMALIYDEELKDALKAEYGNEYFEFIKSLKAQPLPRIKQHEYKEYHFKALAVIKRLELTFSSYSKEERLELRNSINKELGIYPDEFTQFKFAY